MMKTLLYAPVLLPVAVLASGCATASPEDYAFEDCDNLRSLVAAQDYAASVRGVEFENDRGMEELRQASGSPWAGKPRTRDESNLRDERQAVREAYRRKGCKA
ncbi:MAG: hypothetical protein ABJO36_13875 [Litorimonas sp.]|jgi:hypothetical protein